MRAKEIINENWYKNLETNKLHMMGYTDASDEEEEPEEDSRSKVKRWRQEVKNSKKP